MRLKILMVAGENIGYSAAAHISELTKEILKSGAEVIIASDSEELLSRLNSSCARCEHIDVSAKGISSVGAFFSLMRLIISEKPNAVHAHGDSASKLCGAVRAVMRFNLIASSYDANDARAAANLFHRYGTKVFTLSDESKNALVSTCGMGDNDFSPSVFGIDTDMSAPSEAEKDALSSELFLNRRSPVIVHIAGENDKASTVSDALIAASEKLSDNFPGAQTVIVCGGDGYEHIAEKANDINARLGRNCVYPLRSVSDANALISLSDIFIGSSRYAMESLLLSKPLIVADDNGFDGLFTHERISASVKNSFRSGVRDETSDTAIYDACAIVLKSSVRSRDRLGAFGREVICDEMNISKTAEGCVSEYEKYVSGDVRVLFSGYYGFGNSGDEATLSAAISAVRSKYPHTDITVLSKTPERTALQYECNSVYRFNVFKVLASIRKCDILVSGGGSLFQDTTSTRSLIYYTAMVYIAKLMKKKVMIYANGIGPVMHDNNRRITAGAVMKADAVTLRDRNSYEELRDMGVFRTDIKVTADPVFGVKEAPVSDITEIYDSYGIPNDKPIIMVSVRQWDTVHGFNDKIARLCDSLADKYGCNIVFLAMQIPDDGKCSAKIAASMKNKAYIIDKLYLPEQLAGIIGKARFMIGMRLHSLVFASRMGVPFVGIVYDPKVRSYLETFDMFSIGTAESFDYLNALTLSSAVMDDIGSYRAKVRAKADELTEISRTNTVELFRLIDGVKRESERE